MDSLIRVKDLFVSYKNKNINKAILNGLSFSISKGETLVIVGESGSGKTTLGKTLSGLLPPSTQISGKIKFNDSIFDITDPMFDWGNIRGKKIGHIFQDPQSSLNPRKKIKKQFYETLVLSQGYSKEKCKFKSLELLNLLNFKNIEKVLDSYPFQLSGGMCQRVCIALSLCLEPDLLIADEITSALDLKSQFELIQLLNSIKSQLNAGMLFITHDLELAKKIGDRILFLDKGILTVGEFQKTITNKDKYEPRKTNEKNIKKILEIDNLTKKYNSNTVLKELSVSINEGEIFGMLGESGCGKSTLARLISGIESSYTGRIIFNDKSINDKLKKEGRYFYKDIQIIFQDERGCLNPYKEIISIVEEPIRNLKPDIADKNILAKKNLRLFGLDESLYKNKASNLSTGQCQRVSIARAIVVEPKLLILDEVVSALDTNIKIQILQVLKNLQQELNVTMLMISHEIDVLQSICQRVALLKNGKVDKIIEVNNESVAKMKEFLMEV